MVLLDAKEARQKTLQNIDVIVSNFLKEENLEHTLIERLNRHIDNGELKVEHNTRSFIYQAKNNISKEIYNILAQFKRKGYKVNVEDIGNGYWSKLKIKIEW